MSTLRNVVVASLAAGLVAMFGGCASKQPTAAASPASEPVLSAPDPALATQARTVRIFRGGDGSLVDWESVVSASSSVEALVIGENHGHPLGLAFAQELWSDVVSRRDAAVLSMEFFTRDEQSRLDDYLTGLWDEASFLKATRRTSDAIYPPGHRSMVQTAKARSRPVIAANAPRVYVRTSSRESYERLASLTPEQRRMFRVPDSLPTGRYRADYDALMSDPAMASHGGPPKQETPDELRKRLDSGFRAQSLWDWTMADSIAKAIDEHGTPVVHVVGRFHSDFRGGLIEALLTIRPGTRVVTVSVVDAWSDSLRDADRNRADYVVYVGASD
jgi:uncharacterized iron-regulated protein